MGRMLDSKDLGIVLVWIIYIFNLLLYFIRKSRYIIYYYFQLSIFLILYYIRKYINILVDN